jgi:predicted DNA-binding transcriptional regulator AlpA
MRTALDPLLATLAAAGGLTAPRTTAPCFFDRKALAALLQLSLRTIDRLDADGKLPPAVRVGAAKRWTRASIKNWIRRGCPGREERAAPARRRK